MGFRVCFKICYSPRGLCFVEKQKTLPIRFQKKKVVENQGRPVCPWSCVIFSTNARPLSIAGPGSYPQTSHQKLKLPPPWTKCAADWSLPPLSITSSIAFANTASASLDSGDLLVVSWPVAVSVSSLIGKTPGGNCFDIRAIAATIHQPVSSRASHRVGRGSPRGVHTPGKGR